MLLTPAFIAIGLGALQAYANIIFNYVQPTCDNGLPLTQQGCLRGQTCLQDNSCEQNWAPRIRDAPSLILDGHCMPNSNDATCDAKQPKLELQSTTTSDSEPVIGPRPTSFGTASTGAPTTDGNCGASNNGVICGNWHLGGCCSMYGFCGDTDAHCGDGCQSGPCKKAPVAAAPSPVAAPMNARPGSFEVIGESGVPAMHAALMPNGRVVFLDKVENYTQLKLAKGRYAYSSEYDLATNTVVPLAYKTNAFCAGGAFLANGTLLSVGGNSPLSWLDPTVTDGFRGLRYLTRSSEASDLGGQEWMEPGNELDSARWYPTVQTLGDGTIFVASGSLNGLDPTLNKNNNPTYELLDPDGISHGGSIPMPLLVKAQPYFMYPFVHLLPTSDLFVFTSKSSELFSVSDGKTSKELPELPGDHRTYPNTGGSVLLPLSSTNNWSPSVLICGGGAYQDVNSPTDPSCGRIDPLADSPQWEMDAMPEGRGMVEATLLPDGTVLWLNGAKSGAQGFGHAAEPTTEALIYDPSAPLGKRWTRGAGSDIPRLYHSVALLLLDGSVMIAGSNPVQMPVLKTSDQEPFATEFRVEVYKPSYLDPDNARQRPTDVKLSATKLSLNSEFEIIFDCAEHASDLKVALYHGGFVTHSLHMGLRMLFLDNTGFIAGNTQQRTTVSMPNNPNLTPPGPYIVYVVVDGKPSIGQFVTVSTDLKLSSRALNTSVAQGDQTAQTAHRQDSDGKLQLPPPQMATAHPQTVHLHDSRLGGIDLPPVQMQLQTVAPQTARRGTPGGLLDLPPHQLDHRLHEKLLRLTNQEPLPLARRQTDCDEHELASSTSYESFITSVEPPTTTLTDPTANEDTAWLMPSEMLATFSRPLGPDDPQGASLWTATKSQTAAAIGSGSSSLSTTTATSSFTTLPRHMMSARSANADAHIDDFAAECNSFERDCGEPDEVKNREHEEGEDHTTATLNSNDSALTTFSQGLLPSDVETSGAKRLVAALMMVPSMILLVLAL